MRSKGGVRQDDNRPQWWAKRRTFPWECEGGKATAGGAGRAAVIQTQGEKCLEKNPGTRAERKG